MPLDERPLDERLNDNRPAEERPSNERSLGQRLASNGEGDWAEPIDDRPRDQRSTLRADDTGDANATSSYLPDTSSERAGERWRQSAVGVYDVGRMINPRLARSQIVGGMLFGFSMALMESTIPDEKTGRIVNPNLAEYHVAVHADTPEFDIDFINEPDPHMPDLGARGIGEIGIVGAPAAIANAIFNATGKRVRDLPITPDQLI